MSFDEPINDFLQRLHPGAKVDALDHVIWCAAVLNYHTTEGTVIFNDALKGKVHKQPTWLDESHPTRRRAVAQIIIERTLLYRTQYELHCACVFRPRQVLTSVSFWPKVFLNPAYGWYAAFWTRGRADQTASRVCSMMLPTAMDHEFEILGQTQDEQVVLSSLCGDTSDLDPYPARWATTWRKS